MEGHSYRSPVEARDVFHTRLRNGAASCAAALQFCHQAAGVALQFLWARAHQLLWASAALSERETQRTEAPRRPWSEEAVVRKRALRIAFNKHIVNELLETAEKQPQFERGFLEVLVKDVKTMVQFAPL